MVDQFLQITTYGLWSKSRYKCFEVFDELEERILQTDQLKTLQSVCNIALTISTVTANINALK